jgi:hypothetical protein
VTPVDNFTLLVGLDDNYPGGNGRVPGTPDDTEIITLRSRCRCPACAWVVALGERAKA